MSEWVVWDMRRARPATGRQGVTAIGSHQGGPRPTVFARLAREAKRKEHVLPAPAWSRLVGWPMVLATFAVVVAAAVIVQPWG